VTLFGESAGAISIAILYFNSELEYYIRGAVGWDLSFHRCPPIYCRYYNREHPRQPLCSSLNTHRLTGTLSSAPSQNVRLPWIQSHGNLSHACSLLIRASFSTPSELHPVK
jgi:hypothetical protein